MDRVVGALSNERSSDQMSRKEATDKKRTEKLKETKTKTGSIAGPEGKTETPGLKRQG